MGTALASRGVFFPVDPSSAGFCTFGGAFAQNSAGPHGLKYGVTADHVIGAQIVLADGETLRKRFKPAQIDWLPPRTSSVMLVEFSGFSGAETSGRPAELRARLAERLGSPPVMRQRNDPAGCRELWKLRQGGQKLGNRIDPLRKYTAFVEDVAFDPAIAVRFIREMKRIVAANGVTATIDGHIGVGNLHIYPLLDLKTADDCALMEAISNDFVDLVHDVDGCLSGEHGIGIVRTDALRRRHIAQPVREALAAKDPDFVVTNCGMCELQLRQSLAQPATQPVRLLDKLLER